MILYIDTSTPVCKLTFTGGTVELERSWEAGRKLSLGLLSFIQDSLHEAGTDWAGIAGIVVFRGPGSFTGLRIGASVMNALANARNISIVGTAGDEWKQLGCTRLEAGESDQVVIPDYGADANITTPRK